MSPILIFLIVFGTIIVIAAVAILGWRMVEKHTFSEFFVGQVIREQKGRIPGFKQYVFTYKKRGKPNIVGSRPLWRSKHLKNGRLYQIQIFHRKIEGNKYVTWAIPVLKKGEKTNG